VHERGGVKFLYDNWYVAALENELTTKPISRQILGRHVALFRTESGEIVALDDACPHRGYPLSLGRVNGETLVCGYHGFTFNCSGTCVEVPGQDRVPSRANVRSYPVVTTGPWVWIWTGRSDANYEALPKAPWLHDENWDVVSGMATIDAPFSLLVDNLLDLSHETYLHGGSIGTPEVASTPIEVESDEEANVVRVYRHMRSVECPPFYERTTGLSGRVDRWQDIEYFAPGFYLLHSRIAPIDQPPLPDGTDDHAFHLKVFYGLTPANETQVHDFWALSRDFARKQPDIDNFLQVMQTNVVQEDVDALTILHQRLAATLEPSEVSIKIDKGGLAARRVLESMGATPNS
jgi:phenylpropionate dioxygenase-like ring-hydroxylating dioxygenase large terminal subunit